MRVIFSRDSYSVVQMPIYDYEEPGRQKWRGEKHSLMTERCSLIDIFKKVENYSGFGEPEQKTLEKEKVNR